MAQKKEEENVNVTPETSKDPFLKLVSINMNDKVSKKNTGKAVLTYLSWPDAWGKVRALYPDITYEIKKNEMDLPYFVDPMLGIMVYTSVTIQGETREMWLPVMDCANNAMKLEPYTIKTQFGEKVIPAADMTDINKTVMRCLVKNIAMFGLGLYIYSGEDVPQETVEFKAGVDAIVKQCAAEIDRLKADGKLGTPEEKKKLVENVINPIVGTSNYKLCRDEDKLNALLLALKAA